MQGLPPGLPLPTLNVINCRAPPSASPYPCSRGNQTTAGWKLLPSGPSAAAAVPVVGETVITQVHVPRAQALPGRCCYRLQPPITVPMLCNSMVSISNCQHPIISRTSNSPLTGSYRGRPRGGMQLSTWVLPSSASSAASLHECTDDL